MTTSERDLHRRALVCARRLW